MSTVEIGDWICDICHSKMNIKKVGKIVNVKAYLISFFAIYLQFFYFTFFSWGGMGV